MPDQQKVQALLSAADEDLRAAVEAHSRGSVDHELDRVITLMFAGVDKVWTALAELAGSSEVVQEATTLTVHEAVRQYAQGVNGVRPQAHVVGTAERILQEALDQKLQVMAGVDVEGTLRLTFGVSRGRFLTVTLGINGRMSGNLYGPDWTLLRRIAEATEGEIWGIVHSSGVREG